MALNLNFLKPQSTISNMALETDFIVIGSGVAGLRASIELAKTGARVTVLTKDKTSESNTEYAQGGVAVVLSDDDNATLHEEDTLIAGAGLCDEKAVETLVVEGTKYIQQLIEWGTEFDREGGKLVFTREAAHSRRRILHAHGDSTGKEIVRALIARARQEKTIVLMPFANTESLIVKDGRCVGVGFLDPILKAPREIYAKAVILCTGGAGQLYQHSTNPPVATGDGMAMSYFAGAEIADMEFVQFHPTALNLENAPRFLLSEAMRGEGAILRNAHGKRFMGDYDERLELAPRDIVSRSIVSEMRKTGTRTAFLDITDKSRRVFNKAFPKNLRYLQIFRLKYCNRLDSGFARIALHDGRSSHRPLGQNDDQRALRGGRSYLHGSSRGESTGFKLSCSKAWFSEQERERSAFEDNAEFRVSSLKSQVSSPKSKIQNPKSEEVSIAVKKRVKRLMWENVGIVRDRDSMQRALSEFEQISQAKLSNASRNFVTLAKLVTSAALWREESRGGHFRSDFPETLEDWRVHSIQRIGQSISTSEKINFNIETQKTQSN